MRNAFLSLLAGATFLLVACKEPKTDFVFLENGTNKALQVTVEFKGEDTESGPLKFLLDPGERDGWRFTQDKRKSKARLKLSFNANIIGAMRKGNRESGARKAHSKRWRLGFAD